jgi:hypothetical protein
MGSFGGTRVAICTKGGADLSRQGYGHLALGPGGSSASVCSEQEPPHESSPSLNDQLCVLVGRQPKAVDGPGLIAPSEAPLRFQARIVQAHAVVEPALFQPHHLDDLVGHSLDERGGGGTALGSDLGRCFHPSR